MWNFIVCNIGTINGIILFLTLIVIIWYTIETRKTRLSNEKNLSVLEAQNKREIELVNNRHNLSHSYILSQLESLIESTKVQNKNVIGFIELLKQEKTINLVFTGVVGFNANKIRIISPPELFDLYVLRSNINKTKNLKSFNLLLKQLDLVDGLSNSFLDSFNYSLEHFNKYEDKWNENIEAIRMLHDNWITTLTSQGIDPLNDPFLKEFIEIYHQNAQIENYRDMYVSENSLIKPTLKKAKESQPNLLGETLLNPLLKCLDAVSNHRNLRQIKIKEFEHYKNQLDDISKNLIAIKNNFSLFSNVV